MTRKQSSLRRQLLWYLLVPVGTLSFMSIVLAFYLGEKFLTTAYDESLFDTTETLARQVRVVGDRVVVDIPQVAWEMLRYDDYDKVFSAVKWANGGLIAGDAGIPDPPAALKKSIGKPIFHDGFHSGEQVRIASLYVPVRGNVNHREILIQTAETLMKRDSVRRQIFYGVALSQLVLVVLAALSVWIGVARGLAPLRDVSRSIANRSHRDLSPVDEKEVPHEVQPLLRSINGLMHRFSHVLETQRRFVADAAHQLRTPIAGLKTQTEYAMRQTDIAAVRQVLPQINVSVERTNRLINQLLKLARSEVLIDQPGVFERLDLDRLLREVTAEWVPVAMQKDIDLGYESADGPVEVSGNAVLLREMFANVIDNAIRHAAMRGTVTVRLSNSPRPRVAIEDDGVGIPVDEREHVFQRFYRLSENAGEGSGLGLSIVREIAGAHGARVWFDDATDGKGALINIEFS